MDKIYDLLTKQLLSQPFPYKETLKKQLDTAKYDIEAYEDALKIMFCPDDHTERLPELLHMVPLSWQLFPSGGCLGCDLFVENGYIDCLQIVDYAGKGIHWDELSKCTAQTEIDYDPSNICRLLSRKVELRKIRQGVNSIDIALTEGVACFRGCIIRRFDAGNLPSTKNLQIKLQENSGTLYSDDGSIDIAFQLVFLRYHTRM